MKDVDIDNILIFKKIFLCKKNCKYFICYTDDHEIKPFSIILPKMGAYKKVMMVELNGCFLIVEGKI